MKLIVCLGNPGESYARNRHNIGFRVGEVLCQKYHFEKGAKKHHSAVFEGVIGTQKCVLLFPQTFMNVSGSAVQSAFQFYKLPLSHILVVYDDFDIPFGTLRFKEKGSAGTHNGMKDTVLKLGSTDFPRLRIGIGPKPPHGDTADFVLSNFTKEEESKLPDMCNEASLKIYEWSSQ